jgi:hypothetical protein
MKTTEQRLSEVYCRPTTQEEWDLFGLINLKGHQVMVLAGEPTLVKGDFPNRTEIPVTHFQDLLNDSIVAWRLIEDDFVSCNIGLMTYVGPFRIKVGIDGGAYLDGTHLPNVKTYTQLLTLIELIG